LRGSEGSFFLLWRRGRGWCRFLAVQLANRKRLDLPRRGLGFGLVFPLANLLLVDVAHEHAYDIRVVALLQLLRRVFREVVSDISYVESAFLSLSFAKV
jgi:hypothetical protein